MSDDVIVLLVVERLFIVGQRLVLRVFLLGLVQGIRPIGHGVIPRAVDLVPIAVELDEAPSMRAGVVLRTALAYHDGGLDANLL